ncbi:MAG: hypothetical protein K2N73_07850 [Lachnospiraceae bacterium]|nr:hypothetical protein [Lachnospiraceae bacterium]
MDIERGNLEIVFKEIFYTNITYNCPDPRKRHDYARVNKDLYMWHSQKVFRHQSEDERLNNFQLMTQTMQSGSKYEPSVFQLITDASKKMLIYGNNEIRCRFDEMLRWREISLQMGQDFFTCAFLADYDLNRGGTTQFFAWIPIIMSDNDRLHNILKKGMAENHFHLNGSTKVFELNWMCLMNLIEGRRHDFKKIRGALQESSIDRIMEGGHKENLYAECQRAALYRVYLFAQLRKDEYLIEKTTGILNKVRRGMCIEVYTSEIQDAIVLAKSLYGARVDGKALLDYALQKDMIDRNNNACRLLAGERKFLYECYKACFDNAFNSYQKNMFYQYLLIRTHFRGELIQINRQVGFANFSNYQDRKEYFIEGQREYEKELIKLAVCEPLEKKNMISLEARICPKNTAVKLYRCIKENEKVIDGKNGADNRKVSDKLIYVLHFPKCYDLGFARGMPRNYNVRSATMKQTKALVSLLERGTSVNRYIRGIDACSSELACRPEVFAQAFRYLTGITYDYSAENNDMPFGQLRKGARLHTTYHAGEDFFDIADGLRAIDETILFCGLGRGSRIGHALALGINPYEYYKYKGNKLVISKQVMLDDIAWILCTADEWGCSMDSQLRAELNEKYYEIYNQIYQENNSKCSVSVLDYFQSWKLRGDNPAVYRLEAKAFQKRLRRTELQKIKRYEFNDKVNDSIRKNDKFRKLYYDYHYNENVRKKGDEMEELKVDYRYADIIYQLQEKMISKLVTEGIGIETNPSSNYLIGTITKYEEHPILRFNSKILKTDIKNNMSLSVSINTDDQGVFDTLLENEYALMALALKKSKDEKRQAIYDAEDIYKWIDYVREMGVEQVFIN